MPDENISTEDKERIRKLMNDMAPLFGLEKSGNGFLEKSRPTSRAADLAAPSNPSDSAETPNR